MNGRNDSWTLRARSNDLTAGAVINDWSGTLLERFNVPDTLQVTGQTSDLRPLFKTAAGATFLDGGVTLNDGSGRRFSGPLSTVERRGDGTCTLTFESDLIWWWGRVAFPDPASSITPTQSKGYDTRTGPAETVALAYIDANAGPGALVTRRVPGLTVPSSLGRGGTTTINARLDVLGRLVADIGEAAGLRFRIVQDGTTLAVAVSVAADLSAVAKYGDNNAGGPGLLSDDWTWTIGRPSATRMVVGGGGLGVLRDFDYLIDTDAEALWGIALESFYDASSDFSETQSAHDRYVDALQDFKDARQDENKALDKLRAAQRRKAITAEARADHSTTATIQNDTDAAQDVLDATTDYTAAVSATADAANDRDNAYNDYLLARAAYLGQMTQDGQDELDQATQPVSIDAPTVYDSPDLRLGVDVPLGSKVALNLDDELVIERLRQVTTVIARQDGQQTVSITGQVGSPDAGLTRGQKEFLAMRKTLRRVVTR